MLFAKDVYNIAKALSKEEYLKLYDSIKSDVNKTEFKIKSSSKLPDFSKYDALKFVLENIVKKPIRTNRTK